MRRHLIDEHNGRLGNSVRPTRICSRTRRGEIPQEDHPRARDHDLLIDARRRRSTSASTPTARKRNLRKTRNPSERAGQPTCLGAYTRRQLTLSPSRCTAGELEQFNRRHQRPHQRSFLAASLHCSRKSPGQFFGTGKSRYSEEITATSKISYSDSECIRVQGASARFEQGRTQKQIELKPATIRVHRQAATSAGRSSSCC